MTKRQQQIYEDAVNNDLSLSELAESYGISRQGVHDLLRRCDKTLSEYEEKLGCIKRDAELKKTAEKLRDEGAALGDERICKLAERMLELIL